MAGGLTILPVAKCGGPERIDKHSMATANAMMRTQSFTLASVLLMVSPVAPAQDASKLTLVGKERFVATPGAGTRVAASAFYTRKTGVEMISRHTYQTRSDTADVSFQRFSTDNGGSWSVPTEIRTHRSVENGTLRRYMHPGVVDPENGTLVTFILQGILPGDNPLEGMKQWTLRYALSRDGGRTTEHESQVIHVGDEYSPEHPLPDVWVGKNSVMIGDSTCLAIRTRRGEILQPVQITPLGPDGEYYNPGGGYTYHDAAVLIGRWNDNRTLDWRLSRRVQADPKRSTRGMIEPTIAEMPDGRILMVLRGSNDTKPALPGYRWFSVSSDSGHTWSPPRPWTYADDKPFHSPSSCSQLLRHSNRRRYWIGNITPDNSRGNHPRYPLVIGEVDPDMLGLIRASICIIDERNPNDPPTLQISNFHALEDRVTQQIIIYCSPFNRPHPLTGNVTTTKLDWTSDAMLYRLDVKP